MPSATGERKRRQRDRATVRQSIVTRDMRKEFDSLIEEVFVLADTNSSGTIRFGEFLAHHEKFMDATDLPSTDYMEQEQNFRRLDKDSNGSLSMEEFGNYMESLLAVLGGRTFRQTCQELIEKEQERRGAEAKGFDWRFSERLLEQARNANFYLPQMQDSAVDFIEQKADPNHVDTSGSHCLLYASVKANASFIARLLQSRADPMLHNKAYECAAFKAARARSLDTISLLLLPSPPDNLEDDDHEEEQKASISLVRDMSTLNEAGIQKLLAKRADINFKDESGWTPLTTAVFFGELGRIEALMRSQKATGRMRKLRFDLLNGKGRGPLHIAARKGHDELIMHLVRAKGNPDGQDIDGWTPLHHAAFNGMSQVVDHLLQAGADMQIQGRNGLTPWQVTLLPTSAGSLGEETLAKLKPPDSIDYGKSILPILKDDEKTLYEKLHALLSLPTVCWQTKNLRLHEQCFHPRHGPNKVRLRKLWQELALPMAQRLHSGITDLREPSSRMTEDERHERLLEISTRQKEQERFVAEWLKATKGIRPTCDWKFEGRAEYAEELADMLESQQANFAKDLERLYEATLELEGGRELAELPAEEVLKPNIVNQLSVHTIPLWVEELNPAGAFEALRLVGAYGMGRSDEDSMLAFMDLLTLECDFFTGPFFWRNVYRLWLSEYAKVADLEFHKVMKGIVERFNTMYDHEKEMRCEYQHGPVKTYERIKAKEREFGVSTHTDYQGRVLASNVLDLIRGSITVSSPQAALVLMNDFIRPIEQSRGRLKLVRIENRFHADARTEHGYRNLALTVIFDGGLTAGRCGRPGASMQVAVVGEVLVNLASFAEVQRRRQVLTECAGGAFDWLPREEGAAEKGGLNVDDDLPAPGS
mmetsp:Transcript_109777/g.321403  ORF Transcript_109777/g.321403 Transcript_109777/m.321403 type:complete len:876 (+) Transcript_109777:102-2729(+)